MSDDYSFFGSEDPGTYSNVLMDQDKYPVNNLGLFDLPPQGYAQGPSDTASDAPPPSSHPNPVLAPYVKAFGADAIAKKIEEMRNDPRAQELLQGQPELTELFGALPQEPITGQVLGSHPTFTQQLNVNHLKALMGLYSKYAK